jgi:iron-sulfur cluster repair protein YtfE (RIC family)
MRDPIERLLEEHRAILANVEHLRRALADLGGRGDDALPEVRPALEAVGEMMGTELLAHARREDEALFPALEAVLGGTDGPTGVMRAEHRAIHGQADRFRRTLHELNEVEHPAIVAAGARLRTLTASSAASGSAAELCAIGATILELIDLHFGKEEDILFPMARDLLAPEALRAVARRMEVLDAAS